MVGKKRVQHIRSIKKTEKPDGRLNAQSLEFPKDKPGAIYVRQSTVAQVQKNLHSYEMQTSEFVKHFREKMGVCGHIEVITDDEGKSGTLGIHDREGLSRVVRLIEGEELLNGERIGWVGAVHVNRFTRDKWLIVPGTLMKECYENDVWISTLRMNYNFKDEYCQRVFMLEAEEAAKHLGWLKEVLQGGLQIASEKGFYDGRGVLFGYITDYCEELEDGKKSTYKRYIVYEPHAKVVKWLFQRYLELDGSFQDLCREVAAMPYLFPAFEKGIDKRSLTKCAGKRSIITEGPYRGCYKPTDTGLWSLLINPTYLGWWIPRGGGLIEENHHQIIEPILFSYAHKRLSLYNLEGTRVKPHRATRNGDAQALLKKVIKGSSPDYHIYPDVNEGTLFYRIRHVGKLLQMNILNMKAVTLDEAFTAKFFERLKEWLERGELDKWKENAEYAQDQAHSSRQTQKDMLTKEIAQAKAQRQETMDLLDDPEIPKTKQMKIDYAQKVARLEDKIQELQKKQQIIPGEEEEENMILYRIWDLIPNLQSNWAKLDFQDRLIVVGAFTRRVIMEHPSPAWIKITVEWKIGECDVMHLKRPTNAACWTKEEDTILRELWPTEDCLEVLKMLPNRSHSAIVNRASKKGVRRTVKSPQGQVRDYEILSLQDIQYAEECGLDTTSKNPQWRMQR